MVTNIGELFEKRMITYVREEFRGFCPKKLGSLAKTASQSAKDQNVLSSSKCDRIPVLRGAKKDGEKDEDSSLKSTIWVFLQYHLGPMVLFIQFLRKCFEVNYVRTRRPDQLGDSLSDEDRINMITDVVDLFLDHDLPFALAEDPLFR